MFSLPQTLRFRVFAPVLGLTFVSCVTSEPEEPVWQDPTTSVETFDPAGRPTSGRALADQVWGLGDQRVGKPIDWERVETIRDGARAPDEAPATSAPGPTASATGAEEPAKPTGAGGEPATGAAETPDTSKPAATTQDPKAEGDAEQDPPLTEDERLRREARLRNTFGAAIVFNDDGTLTKQYFLSTETGAVFLNLLAPLDPPAQPRGQNGDYGGQQLNSVLGRMLGPDHKVEIIYIQDFEQFGNIKPRANPRTQAVAGGISVKNSLLLVTADPSALAAFEKALKLFYANIPQVLIEVKVVEYQISDSISFGIVPIDANTPTVNNLKSGRLIQSLTSNFPLSLPLTGTGGGSDQGVISLGGIHDALELNAVLQALETRNVADIQSQPTMVVRNGGTATVATTTAQPFPKARISNQTVTTTDINFQDVGIIMDIRPEIAGTDTVVLNLYISVSSVTGFAATDPVPTPIVSTREATTSVHLREGESTVIGGLVSEQTFDSETKFPILGDIPILGYLFRSTSTQTSKTVLEFHIRPEILVGRRGSTLGSGF